MITVLLLHVPLYRFVFSLNNTNFSNVDLSYIQRNSSSNIQRIILTQLPTLTWTSNMTLLGP